MKRTENFGIWGGTMSLMGGTQDFLEGGRTGSMGGQGSPIPNTPPTPYRITMPVCKGMLFVSTVDCSNWKGVCHIVKTFDISKILPPWSLLYRLKLFFYSLPLKKAKNLSLLVILGTQMTSQFAYFRHLLCVTLAWYANGARNAKKEFWALFQCSGGQYRWYIKKMYYVTEPL